MFIRRCEDLFLQFPLCLVSAFPHADVHRNEQVASSLSSSFPGTSPSGQALEAAREKAWSEFCCLHVLDLAAARPACGSLLLKPHEAYREGKKVLRLLLSIRSFLLIIT